MENRSTIFLDFFGVLVPAIEWLRSTPTSICDGESETASFAAAIKKYTVELNKGGYSELHEACREGALTSVRSIIGRNRKLCFVKDKDGRTPLHVAVMKGRVDVIELLLKACPESVKEETATGETCLHTAVVHNKGKAVQYLLKWLAERTDYAYLINSKDNEGNTALHLATSRKQLQTLRLFLTGDPSITEQVDVNAVNFGGITALDILYVLPPSGKIDMDIDKILRKTGVLRGRYLAHRETKRHIVCKHRNSYDALLVTATLLATIAFHAAISFPSTNSKGASQLNKGDLITARSFILLNSLAFIASVASIIFLLNEFPLKPWPQFSASTLFGSYMCLIMEKSPHEALPLLIVSIPFLLLAAAGKLYGFSGETCLESSCRGGA